MKNIYLIRTTEATILHSDYDKFGNVRFFLSPMPQVSSTINSECLGYHLYITSNEEVKDGDAQFDIDGDVGFAMGKDTKEWEGNKKMVFTSDPRFINEGVQALEERFVEWYIYKFNECGVLVQYLEVRLVDSPCCGECDERLCDLDMGNHTKEYKLIIPEQTGKDLNKHTGYDEEGHSLNCEGNILPLETPKSLADFKCTCRLSGTNCFSGRCSLCGLPKRNVSVESVSVGDETVHIITEEPDEVYSREDMLEFGKFCDKHAHTSEIFRTFEELLKAFNEKYL